TEKNIEKNTEKGAEKAPKVTIIEADEAACIFESVKHGELIAIGGNPQTIMAGLNCGETNRWIFPVLRDFSSNFARCPDWVTVRGMRKLAHPESGDEKVVSGESGAVGFGLLLALCQDREYAEEKEQMGLDKDSVILLFSTEGDTDPENYKRIVNEKEV
ncbi:MAG: pyridoxal-phosphate dependent enzyme, partial [Actinobacteria bacterium]|nr:pyridoxal-phosphate dependent enzyme [Actinomycetota bacterium]